MQDIQAIVDSIYDSMVPRLGEGKVADYIPELAKVDPNQFGIAITTVDGTTYTAGNALTPFSIQSISKVFMLTLALGKAGETVWNGWGESLQALLSTPSSSWSMSTAFRAIPS